MNGVAFDSQAHIFLLASAYTGALLAAAVLYRKGKELIREGEKQREVFYSRLADAAYSHDDEVTLSATGHQVEIRNHWGIFDYDDAGYILKYDIRKSLSTKATMVFRHTVFCAPQIALRILVAIFIAMVAGFTDYVLLMNDAKLEISVDDVDSATQFFNTFVGIMLGFYMSTVLARWWDVRMNTMGRMWGAVDDTCLIMAAHLPGYQLRPLRKLVLRYALASFELTFMQAQGDNDVEPLVGRSLLTADEALVLRSQPSKSQVIWTWVSGLFYSLHRQGHIDTNMLPFFYSKVLDARGGIGATFAYLDTQMPFIYVHLLAVLVHAANVIVSIDAGVTACHVVMQGPSDVAGRMTPVVRLLRLCLQTFFYNAFLEIGRIFSDPLGTDVEDFPRHAWHCFMRNECEAFDFAGYAHTSAMQKATASAAKAQMPLAALGAVVESEPRVPKGHTLPTLTSMDSAELTMVPRVTSLA